MNNVSKAVVTGGAGFIGSHIVDRLLERGIETIVIDDFSTGSRENLKQHAEDGLLRVIPGEVSQIDSLLAAERDIDIVFHEAAIASVPKSIEDPLLVHEVNVNASLKVMTFCVDQSVRRLVFASSAAVYGVLNGAVASEDLPCSPSSPYGASKLAVEEYLKAFRSSYGLETVALRYFNVYGPRQTVSDYSGVITVFSNRLQKRSTPVIFGDGMQTRDFVYVKDVATANLLAMDHERADGEVFNVASGESTSLLKLFATLQRVTGVGDLSPRFDAPRKGDVRSGSASISKIQSLIGFRPSVTLEEGLASMVKRPGGKQTVSIAA